LPRRDLQLRDAANLGGDHLCFVSLVATLTFSLIDPVRADVRDNLFTLQVLERRSAANHAVFPVSDELLLALKHAWAHVSDRWRTFPKGRTKLIKRFPQLADPLNDLVICSQVGDIVNRVLSLELSEDEVKLLYSEADLDEDGSISFAELVYLFSPPYISHDLKATIPALCDPEAGFTDPGPPEGLQVFRTTVEATAVLGPVQ